MTQAVVAVELIERVPPPRAKSVRAPRPPRKPKQVVAARPIKEPGTSTRAAEPDSFGASAEVVESVPEVVANLSVALPTHEDTGIALLEPSFCAYTAETSEICDVPPTTAGENAPSPQAPVDGPTRRLQTAAIQLAARLTAQAARLWQWYRQKRLAQLRLKRMQVAETISLGDKRFLALVRVDDCQFLVGGGASGVALLAQVRPGEGFKDVLAQQAGGSAHS